MGNLSDNLSRSEFTCRCGCGFDTVDVELVKILQELVDHFEVRMGYLISIDIRGGNRCLEHNETVQKKYVKNYVPYSSNSQHMYARAVDFKLFKRGTNVQIPPNVVADYLELKYPNQYGIGRYSNRTHFDTKTGNARRWE